jgi:hypothetical protein
MGRNLSEDAAYAKELGLVGLQGKRTVQRLGGAKKLKDLSPEIRTILVFPCRVKVLSTSLLARGMKRAKDIRTQ